MEQATADDHSHGSHFTPKEAYSVSKLGMWLFLGTEVMLFGGLFAAYAIFRAKYPELFYESHLKLNREMGAVNTCVLLFSSMTMAIGVTAVQRGKQTLTTIMILVTILCGVIFGIVKYFEYGSKFAHDIFPDTNIFFSLYFMLTGLHMLHVFIGLGILAVVMVLNMKGRFNKDYNTPVEMGGLYWHLVDLVWIYLFPLLYLI